MKRMNEVKQRFMAQLALIGKHWGLGEPAGRVWGLLLFEENPLSQREIARECNYSLSLVSPSLTILEKWGLIRSVGKRGREKLYDATTSFLEAFEKLLKNFTESEIEPIISTLSSAEDSKTRKRTTLLSSEYKKMLLFSQFFSRIIKAKRTLGLEQLKKSLSQARAQHYPRALMKKASELAVPRSFKQKLSKN